MGANGCHGGPKHGQAWRNNLKALKHVTWPRARKHCHRYENNVLSRQNQAESWQLSPMAFVLLHGWRPWPGLRLREEEPQRLYALHGATYVLYCIVGRELSSHELIRLLRLFFDDLGRQKMTRQVPGGRTNATQGCDFSCEPCGALN